MLKRFVFILTVFALMSGSAFAAELMNTSDGQPRTLTVGEVVSGPAQVKTAGGGTLFVSAESKMEVQAPEGDIELFLVVAGSVRGEYIGKQTQVAVPTGWVVVKNEERARYYAEMISAKQGFVKVDEGQALLIYKKIHVHLSAGNGIEIEQKASGAVQFRTHQTNAGKVRIIARVTDELEIELNVPKATTGTIGQEQKGKKTRLISNPISWKSGQVTLVTRLDGEKMNSGSLGPGTYAVIDNATGVLELAFDDVDFQIIKRATSLTSELSSLAVSNFFGYEASK